MNRALAVFLCLHLEILPGIADVFEDIEALTARCRFTDCQHETEPGCAIQTAIEDGCEPASKCDPLKICPTGLKFLHFYQA